jgi:uncharacterized Fe-S cluster-containing MiaB family protein
MYSDGFLRFCDDPEIACCKAEAELMRLRTENERLHADVAKLQQLAKAQAEGRLVEAVRCGECRKIMTQECLMCSFDADGHCTGGPDNDQYCSFGEAAEKAIAEVGE